MSPVRLLTCIYCVVFGTGVSLMAAPSSVTDSLQGRLAHTSDPRERVQLLLNLKDLNEDTHLNLPYSIQLFREAAAIRDSAGIRFTPKRKIRSAITYRRSAT